MNSTVNKRLIAPGRQVARKSAAMMICSIIKSAHRATKIRFTGLPIKQALANIK